MIEHVSPDCTCEGKTCKGCKRTLCTGAFYRDRKWLRANCKDCYTELNKSYVQEHYEQILIQQREYKRAHPDSAKGAAYYQKNSDRIKSQTKSYRQSNARLVKKREQAYRQAHLEHIREKDRKYVASNREKVMSRQRNWRKDKRVHWLAVSKIYCAKRRAMKAQSEGAYTLEQWEALKAHYNYTCLRCKKKEPDVTLTADHVIPIAVGGSNSIENIQPLCLHCNCSKNNRTIDYRF